MGGAKPNPSCFALTTSVVRGQSRLGPESAFDPERTLAMSKTLALLVGTFRGDVKQLRCHNWCGGGRAGREFIGLLGAAALP